MGSDSVTLVLINLDKTDWPNATLEIVAADSEAAIEALPASVSATRWLLTGPQGTDSSLVSLNGRLLALDSAGKIPSLHGREELFTTSTNRDKLVIPRIPAESVQFIVLDSIGSLVGCG